MVQSDPDGYMKTAKSFGDICPGRYTDFVIVDTSGKEHHVHRAVMAIHSEYFEAMFNGEFKEAADRMVRLEHPDPYNVFPKLISFAYGSVTDFENLEETFPLLELAKFYQFNELVEIVEDHINFLRECEPESMLKILPQAIQYAPEKTIDELCEAIGHYFPFLSYDEVSDKESADKENTDFNNLSLGIFKKILEHIPVTIDGESSVFHLVERYVEAGRAAKSGEEQGSGIGDAEAEELFALIQFWNLPENLLTTAKVHAKSHQLHSKPSKFSDLQAMPVPTIAPRHFLIYCIEEKLFKLQNVDIGEWFRRFPGKGQRMSFKIPSTPYSVEHVTFWPHFQFKMEASNVDQFRHEGGWMASNGGRNWESPVATKWYETFYLSHRSSHPSDFNFTSNEIRMTGWLYPKTLEALWILRMAPPSADE